MIDHSELRHLTAGAALDDLDPLERRELDQHLATCASCAALALELQDVLADLALVAPERTPPASLQLDILGAIRGEAPASAPAARSPRLLDAVPVPVPVQADARGDVPARRRLSSRLPALAGLATAAVFGLLAVGLGVRAQGIDQELRAARAELAAERAILAIAADPSHRTAALQAPSGPSATVVWLAGQPEAWLVSHSLPATPAGAVYQLWYADTAGVHPLGTFTHDGDGPAVAPLGVDLADSSAVMVTLEPPGGAVDEPGPQVVFGEL